MNKRTLIWPLLLSLLGWLVFGSFYCKNMLCGAGAATAAVIPAATSACSTWAFNDGNSFSAKSNKFYRFIKNQRNMLPNRNASLNTAVAGTVSHLKTNKDRKLIITGHYESDETTPTGFQNMGIARATSVKNSLVSKGVAASQIELKSSILKSNHYHGDTLCQGVDFDFGRIAAAAAPVTKVDNIKTRLKGKNVILYFPTNGDDISLSAQAKKDIEDIKYYLDNVPGSRIEVSGHTDNQGNSSYNKDLSRRRAKDASDYLKRTAGFDKKRMDITGYGEEKPVADNNSSSGRKKNRRVEITLKG